MPFNQPIVNGMRTRARRYPCPDLSLFNFAVIFREQRHQKERIIAMIEMTVEKRSAPRFKVLKGATVAFDGSGVSCTVRNLSSSGAAIEMPDAAVLPPSFMLIIEADD